MKHHLTPLRTVKQAQYEGISPRMKSSSVENKEISTYSQFYFVLSLTTYIGSKSSNSRPGYTYSVLFFRPYGICSQKNTLILRTSRMLTRAHIFPWCSFSITDINVSKMPFLFLFIFIFFS